MIGQSNIGREFDSFYLLLSKCSARIFIWKGMVCCERCCLIFILWCFLFQYRKTSIFWYAASKVEKDQELNKYYRTGLPTSVHCEDNGVKTMSFETQNKFACCNFDIHYFIGVLSDIEMLSVFNYFFYNIKKIICQPTQSQKPRKSPGKQTYF